MNRAPALPLTPEHRATLERWLRAGTTAQRVVLRSRIVLLAADGLPSKYIAQTARHEPGYGARVAPPVRRRGARRVDPRCSGPRAQTPDYRSSRAASRRRHAAHRAASGHPLESADDGCRARAEPGLDSSHLARSWTAAAPRPDVQIVDRPAVRREAHRRRRPVCRPARQGPGLLCRRKEPNPSVAAIPARADGPAGQARCDYKLSRHDHVAR